MGIPETCTGPGDGVGSGGGTSGGAGAGLIGGAGTGLGGVGGDGGGEARGTGLWGTRGGGGGEAGGAAGAGACTLTSSNTAAIVYTYMDGAGRRERKRREAMKERECKRENVKEIGENLCAIGPWSFLFITFFGGAALGDGAAGAAISTCATPCARLLPGDCICSPAAFCCAFIPLPTPAGRPNTCAQAKAQTCPDT